MPKVRVADRGRYTVVPNRAIENASLSFRARGILVWVLSKPDDWWTNSEMISAAGTEGRDAVRAAMKELENAGHLRRERHRNADGTFETVLTFYEDPSAEVAPTPGNPASVNQSSVPQASNKDSEPKTDDLKSSSLRSEELNAADMTPEQTVARAYWNWHVEENGGQPAQAFQSILSTARACLKRGYQMYEIMDAMKHLRRTRFTTGDLVTRIGEARRDAENRPSTAAIPAAVLADCDAAKPWFEDRWPGWYDKHRIDILDAIAVMVKWGYGIGESMVRLAIAMHDPATASSPRALANVDIQRFKWRLQEPSLTMAMEKAYRNRTWHSA